MLLSCVGLVAQSLIDISGETHETVLHADAGEAYVHGHHDHAEEDKGTSHGSLHVLLHHSCGGHCVFIAATPVASPMILLDTVALPADPVRPVPPSDYQAPFRPPIQA